MGNSEKQAAVATAESVANSVERLNVVSDERIGEGGFLVLRRLVLVNQRSDGSVSLPYSCDFVERPYGLDAVAIVVYRRLKGAIEVLLRTGLRPPMQFGRSQHVPIAEPAPSPFSTEIAAGLIEGHDRGLDGIRDRACEEVLEELGLALSRERLVSLGAATVPTASVIPERLYLYAAEITAADVAVALAGDGSPMEEGATTTWWSLNQAVDACVGGEIVDSKTELALRRLRDRLMESTGQ